MALYSGYRYAFGGADEGVPILVHRASISEQHVMENAAHATGLKGLQQSAYGSVADAATSVRYATPTTLPTARAPPCELDPQPLHMLSS